MTTQTLNQTEPNFPREDILQAPFSEKDLQNISDYADKVIKNGDFVSLEEAKKMFNIE